jgi:hypothetical protein
LAKHVLDTTDDFDFALLGLMCPDNQYFVFSAINDALKINLHLSDYVPFNLKDGKLFKFSLYHFMDEELGIEYFLIPNASNFNEPNIHTAETKANDLFKELEVDERAKLVKELPKTDYFLILKGEDIHHYQYKIAEKLKTIPELVQVQILQINDLPSKRNLIF